MTTSRQKETQGSHKERKVPTHYKFSWEWGSENEVIMKWLHKSSKVVTLKSPKIPRVTKKGNFSLTASSKVVKMKSQHSDYIKVVRLWLWIYYVVTTSPKNKSRDPTTPYWFLTTNSASSNIVNLKVTTSDYLQFVRSRDFHKKEKNFSLTTNFLLHIQSVVR